jgi:HSP20 family protein
MRGNQERLPVRRDGSYGTGSISPFSELNEAPGSFFTGNPWQMMRRMQEDMDRLFGQAFGGGGLANFGGGSGGGQMTGWNPSIDVSQTDKEWSIEAELPGVNQEDIDVQVRDNHLFLRAEMRQKSDEGDGEKGNRQYYRRERKYGMVERVFPLPQDVQEDQIRCDFRDGVLTIHVPKVEKPQQQGRRIPVGQAAAGGGQQQLSSQGEGGQKTNANAAYSGEGGGAGNGGANKDKATAGATKK